MKISPHLSPKAIFHFDYRFTFGFVRCESLFPFYDIERLCFLFLFHNNCALFSRVNFYLLTIFQYLMLQCLREGLKAGLSTFLVTTWSEKLSSAKYNFDCLALLLEGSGILIKYQFLTNYSQIKSTKYRLMFCSQLKTTFSLVCSREHINC